MEPAYGSKQESPETADNGRETNQQTSAVYSTSGLLCPPDYSSYSTYYAYQGQGQTVAPPAGVYSSNGSNVIVVTQPQQPQSQYVAVRQSFACHYFWSCLVFWLCGFIFGGIAYIFAVLGSSRASNGDSAGARTMSGASVAFIVIGFIAGCAAWGVLIWWLVVYVISVDACWSFNGICYLYQNCAYSASQCYNFYRNSYYYNGCCYFNY